ncbi:precorrin-3B synthase [Kozakia baliensis]|uniref:Precorrin-3B synthase n=1 Tax=Kozakia baliensis TaxID=153496 RepID=A0A1D8UT37_9PROT|nr:precorrin-3B synthase [Kozakia baliensis]AOX16781.1 precorrin-3B synthase [Kozakia baliensis]
MTGPIVKGWCPGAWRPMRSGDGLLVRVRPPLGRLTQRQASGLAHLATRYGNGTIDLSTRANLQIRGVKEEAHAALLSKLTALGLADPTPEAEARRNVVMTPFWHEDDGTVELANMLNAALQNDPALDLPGKFGFAIDTGATPVLREVSADIRIERGPSGALLCRADGTDRSMPVTLQNAIPAALSLARWFVANGGQGRMAAHLEAGAMVPEGFISEPAVLASFMPVLGPSDSGFMVGIPFGRMEARTLASLADIAPLRMTPWRMILLEGAKRAPKIDGLLVSPDDPLLRVRACPGAPDCAQALQPTRDLARTLAAHVPAGKMLHVSGCEKSCAHPGPATFTLVAGSDGFDLVCNGVTTDPPKQRHLTTEELRASAGLLMKGPYAASL